MQMCTNSYEKEVEKEENGTAFLVLINSNFDEIQLVVMLISENILLSQLRKNTTGSQNFCSVTSQFHKSPHKNVNSMELAKVQITMRPRQKPAKSVFPTIAMAPVLVTVTETKWLQKWYALWHLHFGNNCYLLTFFNYHK